MNNKQLPASTPTEESPIDWPYVCRDCGHGFDASMARQIDIVSDTEAEIMCSWCRHTATYDPPESDDIERPPEIVDHTVFTDDGLTTARLFFEGGAWLQYRRASDEWVYEELFTADGAEVASSKAEFERDDCETPRQYLHREMDRYEKYTVRGLAIHRQHIADLLLHDE